jgi:OOP family OmpA-OmpF porin
MKSSKAAIFAVSMLMLAATPTAFGATVKGDVYRPALAVSEDQAQVFFFRRASPLASTYANDAAHVYVDGHLEGALMPGGHTRFCVKRGTHSIEAYIGDAPLYAGKTHPKTQLELDGGETSFVAVAENGTGEPVEFGRPEAEALLRKSREQRHIINRASAVVPCVAPAPAPVAPPQRPVEFKLNAEVLFEFGRSDIASITHAGLDELKKTAEQILALPPDVVARVTVVGHADPIGKRGYNLALSQQRAQTVGEMLSRYGVSTGLIHTDGAGSAEPVVHCPPTDDRAERIGCNAPNRRVEVNVEIAGSNDGARD